IANQRGEIGAGLYRIAQLVEVALDRGHQALFTGQIEQRRGVAPLQTGRNAAGILHARRFPLTGWAGTSSQAKMHGGPQTGARIATIFPRCKAADQLALLQLYTSRSLAAPGSSDFSASWPELIARAASAPSPHWPAGCLSRSARSRVIAS